MFIHEQPTRKNYSKPCPIPLNASMILLEKPFSCSQSPTLSTVFISSSNVSPSPWTTRTRSQNLWSDYTWASRIRLSKYNSLQQVQFTWASTIRLSKYNSLEQIKLTWAGYNSLEQYLSKYNTEQALRRKLRKSLARCRSLGESRKVIITSLLILH